MESSDRAEFTFASVGLMVGEPDPMMGFPRGTRFVPYLALRNTTPKPLVLIPVLNYMAGGQPVWRTLPDQRLAPLEARQVDLHAAMASLGLAHFDGNLNMTLSYRGHAGDVMVATGSVDETGTYVFEVEPEGLGRSSSKIASYWSVADGFDTMFSLWNPQPEAEDVLVTFYYADGSGKYQLPVHLAGEASTMIDMEMLIMSQQPDADGHVIPSTVRLGSATFASAKGKTQPLTLNISVGTFNVETATCCTNKVNCCGWSNFTTGPPNGTCPVGDTMQCSAQATNCDGTTQTFSATWSSSNTAIATINSSGVMTGVSPGSVTISATFPSLVLFTGTLCPPQTCPMHAQSASSNENITPTVSISGPSAVPLCSGCPTNGVNAIQLSASGNPSGGTFSWSTTSGNITLSNSSSATVTVTSAAASTSEADTPVKVTYTYNSQSGITTQYITIQKPTYLVIYGPDSTTAEAACTTSGGLAGCGVTRTFTYRVFDQIGGGNPINFAGMTYWDSICNTSTNGLNLQGYLTTCGGTTGGCSGSGPCAGHTTNASGEFGETLSVCAPACKSGTGCTTAGSTVANQTWNINGFSVRVQQITYESNKILVNGG